MWENQPRDPDRLAAASLAGECGDGRHFQESCSRRNGAHFLPPLAFSASSCLEYWCVAWRRRKHRATMRPQGAEDESLCTQAERKGGERRRAQDALLRETYKPFMVYISFLLASAICFPTLSRYSGCFHFPFLKANDENIPCANPYTWMKRMKRYTKQSTVLPAAREASKQIFNNQFNCRRCGSDANHLTSQHDGLKNTHTYTHFTEF